VSARYSYYYSIITYRKPKIQTAYHKDNNIAYTVSYCMYADSIAYVFFTAT